jgi:hypothetical protein
LPSSFDQTPADGVAGAVGGWAGGRGDGVEADAPACTLSARARPAVKTAARRLVCFLIVVLAVGEANT